MEKKKATSYALFKQGFSRATYYSIVQGNSISTHTINRRCHLLDYSVRDVIAYIKE